MLQKTTSLQGQSQITWATMGLHPGRTTFCFTWSTRKRLHKPSVATSGLHEGSGKGKRLGMHVLMQMIQATRHAGQPFLTSAQCIPSQQPYQQPSPASERHSQNIALPNNHILQLTERPRNAVYNLEFSGFVVQVPAGAASLPSARDVHIHEPFSLSVQATTISSCCGCAMATSNRMQRKIQNHQAPFSTMRHCTSESTTRITIFLPDNLVFML